MAGGAGGPAVRPGKPEESPLWKVIESGKMPKARDPLTPQEQALVKAWIEKGQFPSPDSAVTSKNKRILDRAATLWSFQKPIKPAVPKARASARARTPIDAFVLAKLEEKHIGFNPDAPRHQLIRRVTLDLTGLPPSPEEVQAFVNDKSPSAYEALIDRLLASPQYGERWARHWLDIGGYADSNGYLGDEPRTEAWRYRDWVVRALNRDMPYDEFITLQLAGDQVAKWTYGERLTEDAIDKLTATGFLRLPADGTDNQKIYQVDKVYDAIHASTEIPMKALMGLSVNCAKCHDHKFDPILQEDYYRLSALLRPVYDPDNWMAANIGSGTTPTRFIPNATTEQVEAYRKLEREVQAQTRQRRTKQLEIYRSARNRWRESQFALQPEPLRSQLMQASKIPEAQRDDAAKKLLKEQEAKFQITDEELAEIDPAVAEAVEEEQLLFDKLKALKPQMIWAAWDVSKNPVTKLLVRGNYEAPGDPVSPGVPLALDDPKHPFSIPPQPPESLSTGRRLAFAKWLTRPENPLTSRVFVNRIWQLHFGKGIVATPDDFGTQGAKPTHPELLDWLAVSFAEHGWSVKWLHRQILLSTAYRQSSSADKAKLAIDETNRLLWRWTPRRLEAEAIRDSVLKVSGQLVMALGGEPIPICRGEDGQSLVDPTGRIDDKLRGTSFKTAPCGKPVSGLDEKRSPNRRSLYLQYRRQYVVDFLVAFDAPMMDTNAPARFRSALPQQTLASLHNPFIVESARKLAERVKSEAGDNTTAQIRRAIELVYSRPVADGEVTAVARQLDGNPDRDRGLQLLCQALLGSSEFLHID
jgi:hypothetical protein